MWMRIQGGENTFPYRYVAAVVQLQLRVTTSSYLISESSWDNSGEQHGGCEYVGGGLNFHGGDCVGYDDCGS